MKHRPGGHLLELSVDEIVEDLRHGLDHVRVVGLCEQLGADAEDVDPGVDGGGLDYSFKRGFEKISQSWRRPLLRIC